MTSDHPTDHGFKKTYLTLYLLWGWSVLDRLPFDFAGSVEQFFCNLPWLNLTLNSPASFALVTLASLSIGLMGGWALAFRTRLPSSVVAT